MKPLTSVRILVVDDHPLTRKGLCDAIRAQPHLAICGEAEGWREALRLLATLTPDLVILDLNLKDGNGWSLLEHLANHLPPTLVLSVCDEELYAPRLLKAGARGYLTKDAPITEILAAIRKIMQGHIAISDAMATRLIQLQ